MFNKIVVGVDGRQGGRDAIELARLLAGPGATITLAHVHGTYRHPERAAEPESEWRERAEDLLEVERADAGIEATVVAVDGPVVGKALHQLADRTGSDLLVVGSCHRGAVGRILLGDDTRAAVTQAPCAVAVAPRRYDPPARLQHIGVGYDDSPAAIGALGIARSFARAENVRVRARAVVSLQDIPYGEPIPKNWPQVAVGLMDDKQRAIRGLGDIDADATYGEPGEQLAHYSEHLDLLLVGSRGYGPVDSMFESSTSRYLARHTRCPLVVVPASSAAAAARSARTIVVGYDGSPAAQAALQVTASEAPHARVLIVNAFELPSGDLAGVEFARRLSVNHDAGLELLDDLPLGMPPLAGPSYQIELLGGDPARALAAVASVNGADRILVGQRADRERDAPAGVEHRLRELTDLPVRAVPADALAAGEHSPTTARSA